MRQPGFWHKPAGSLATSLQPFSWLWSLATNLRLRHGKRTRIGVPVICVGNLNVGGAGKTPLTIAIAQHVTELGHTPHIVSRGYGGRESGPVRVDPVLHDAKQVGDEAILLANFAPTWVARNRAKGSKRAEEDGASIVVLDDGHQNSSVHHDLSLVVVDARIGFGNCRVMPAGPLRESVEQGLARAHLLVVVGDFVAQAYFEDRWGALVSVPVIQARTGALKTGIEWEDMRVVAFAGIAHPRKFLATLREEGASVVRFESLNDHQPLDEALLRRLESEAIKNSAQLVTTEKDATRLSPSWRKRIVVLPVRTKPENWDAIDFRIPRPG